MTSVIGANELISQEVKSEDSFRELNDLFLAVLGEVFLSPHENSCQNMELTHTQGRVLMCLALRGPQRMSDIAKLLVVGLPSATALIDRLVTLKLVKRRKDPSDRRVVLVELTQNGWNIHKNCDASRAAILKKIFSHLSSSEMVEVLTSFRRIRELMKQGSGGE